MLERNWFTLLRVTNYFSSLVENGNIFYIKNAFLFYRLQLDDPDADVTEIAMQLVNVTAVSAHAQAPLQTGDLKLAVDVIEKISERSLKIIQQQYPDATKRAEKVREITQVCLSIVCLSSPVSMIFCSP